MDLLTYTITTALIAAAPGPIMAAILLRGLAGDVGGALALASGILLGEALLMTLAMAGAAAWLETFPTAATAVRWVGAAYLLWVAAELWRPPSGPASLAVGQGSADLAAGLALSVANPYNAAFYLSLLPALGWRIEAMPGLVALATLGPSMVIYGGTILLARLSRARMSGRARPALRRTFAVALGTTAVWIALG